MNHKGTWIVTHPKSLGAGGHFEFTGYIEVLASGVLTLKSIVKGAGVDGGVGATVRIFSPSGWYAVMDKESESLFPPITPKENE